MSVLNIRINRIMTHNLLSKNFYKMFLTYHEPFFFITLLNLKGSITLASNKFLDCDILITFLTTFDNRLYVIILLVCIFETDQSNYHIRYCQKFKKKNC